MIDPREPVPDLEALIYCVERCGFQVVRGEYVRLDGRRATIGLLPCDARELLTCARDALDRSPLHRAPGS